ncbi:unnamed protein product [Effrenium voratum]|uniref:Uncharacterized protein n=1 Tax=Effrenium voratum TaxID=2562239 RepID=A0AA36N6N8_9DINO|nr:unnamed protein product [Effrenium voratum]
MAGEAHPFETTDFNPAWATTMCTSRPWLRPPPLTAISYDTSKPEALFKLDLFHLLRWVWVLYADLMLLLKGYMALASHTLQIGYCGFGLKPKFHAEVALAKRNLKEWRDPCLPTACGFAVCLARVGAADVAKQVVNTPWWPAGSEKTLESVGIISHGFVYMTAMMEVNETLQKTALQEIWDVRDIARGAGAELVDLVDCFVNAPAGMAAEVKKALISAMPPDLQASLPAFTVVEMPGEYQFVYNSIMCTALVPDGKSVRKTWRHRGAYGVSARGMVFIEGSVANGTQDAFEETRELVTRFEELSALAAAAALAECSAFVAHAADAAAVRRALEASGSSPAMTIVQATGLGVNKSVLLRCTAAERAQTIPGATVTDRFVFASAQLGQNTTGLDALASLEEVLAGANVTLKDVINCAFFVKDQQKMMDLFGGFFKVFNQDNPPPPSRGEYQAQSECPSCQVAAKCIAARPVKSSEMARIVV